MNINVTISAEAGAAVKAIAAKVAAEQSLANFQENYLGAFTDPPTQDAEGNALDGDELYTNLTTGKLNFYNGVAGEWVDLIDEVARAIDAATSDAEKQAQSTTQFTDSDGTTFDKGAKGYVSDTEALKNETAQIKTDTQQIKTDTLGILDNFDDLYLGAKASDPSTDNDGDPLQVGALYFNSSEGMKVFSSSGSWGGIVQSVKAPYLGRVGAGEEPYFSIRVKTDNTGTSNDDQVIIDATGDYDLEIRDIITGKLLDIQKGLSGNNTITAPSAGTFDFRIIPIGATPFNSIRFKGTGDEGKMKVIRSIGKDVVWDNLDFAFRNCDNMEPGSITGFGGAGLTSLRETFRSSTFNQPIGDWDVSSVTNMAGMFAFNRDFNQPIGDWDVSQVASMSNMFNNAISFNQDIGSWNVSNVTSMKGLFTFNGGAFDQDLSNWDFESVVDFRDFLNGSQFSTANYDSLLIAIESTNNEMGLEFLGGTSTFSLGTAAETARSNLINNQEWTITDGGGV